MNAGRFGENQQQKHRSLPFHPVFDRQKDGIE